LNTAANPTGVTQLEAPERGKLQRLLEATLQLMQTLAQHCINSLQL
jgi:hypothetical protein